MKFSILSILFVLITINVAEARQSRQFYYGLGAGVIGGVIIDEGVRAMRRPEPHYYPAPVYVVPPYQPRTCWQETLFDYYGNPAGYRTVCN